MQTVINDRPGPSTPSTRSATVPQWSGYLSALGGLAAAATALPSEAAILRTDIVDLTMSTVTENINFDLDQSGPGPHAALNSVPAGTDFQLRSTNSTVVTTTVSFNGAQIAGYYPLKLSAGATIDSTLPWHTGNVNYFEFGPSTSWPGGGEGYIGLRLDAGGGDWRYGWALINFDPANDLMTLKEFAVEMTANTAIGAGAGPVGQVPEPSGLALVLGAMGAGGLAMRRRRAEQAA